jgi:hypothetical protein
MRTWIFMVLFSVAALAQEISVKGSITYVSSGTVYLSIGRGSGLSDSSIVYVITGRDTVASMKVFALSSKSAACAVLTSKRDLISGDVVVAQVVKPEVKKETVAQGKDTAAVRGIVDLSKPAQPAERPAVALLGRVSVQYYTAQFENSAFNLNMPGMVLSMSATARDIPLRFEVYGNMRSLSRGGATPFGVGTTNDSRIYRLTLEYDDRLNIITAGRILSVYSPSIGYIDGVSYARRFGKFTAGAAIGYQPSYTLQGLSTDEPKFMVFTRYADHEFYDLNLTAAYARTTRGSAIDREAVSIGVNAYSVGGLSVYGYGDIDLHKRSGIQVPYSPTVSTAMFSINYRLADFITIGVGADASRPIYLLSTTQLIADSLLDHTLRTGASLSVNLYLLNGVGLYNSYTPRSYGEGFGKDYSNYSSVNWNNVLATGAMLRGTYTMSSNGLTTSQGYGVNIQRNILGADLTVRYQRSNYRILQFSQENLSETYGADLMVLLSAKLSWISSFDAVQGYGSGMNSLFTELSWRF